MYLPDGVAFTKEELADLLQFIGIDDPKGKGLNPVNGAMYLYFLTKRSRGSIPRGERLNALKGLQDHARALLKHLEGMNDHILSYHLHWQKKDDWLQEFMRKCKIIADNAGEKYDLLDRDKRMDITPEAREDYEANLERARQTPTDILVPLSKRVTEVDDEPTLYSPGKGGRPKHNARNALIRQLAEAFCIITLTVPPSESYDDYGEAYKHSPFFYLVETCLKRVGDPPSSDDSLSKNIQRLLRSCKSELEKQVKVYRESYS